MLGHVNNQVRGTNALEMTEGWVCQGMERKRRSDGHSQTGDSRGE